MGTLASTDDCLLDLWEEGQRRAVAVVLDQLHNIDDAVLIELLAAPDLTESGLLEVAARAEQIQARAGRKALEFQLPERLNSLGSALLACGWKAERDSFVMERAATLLELPLPAGLRWRDLGPADVLAYHRLIQVVFAEDPGMQVQDMASFKTMTLQREIPIRLLIHRGRPIAFTRVSRQGDIGSIDTLGRHPSWRGRKLGPLLLAEALRLLEGSRCIRLGVSGSSLTARRLYARYGFVQIERWIAYLKR